MIVSNNAFILAVWYSHWGYWRYVICEVAAAQEGPHPMSGAIYQSILALYNSVFAPLVCCWTDASYIDKLGCSLISLISKLSQTITKEIKKNLSVLGLAWKTQKRFIKQKIFKICKKCNEFSWDCSLIAWQAVCRLSRVDIYIESCLLPKLIMLIFSTGCSVWG